MSFSRIGLWALGDRFTAASLNALDIDHAAAVDGGVSGSTVSGPLAFTAAASAISFGAAAVNGISIAAASKIDCTGTLNIKTGGGLCNINSGGGFSVSAGATMAVASGATCAIVLGNAGSITTLAGSVGQIVLGNDLGDIRVSGTSTRTLAYYCVPGNTSTDWKGLIGATSPGAQSIGAVSSTFVQELQSFNGATLVSVTLYYIAAPGHGGLPATFPQFEIWRSPVGASLATNVSLRAAGPIVATAPNVAAWNDGSVRSLVYTCDQNNTSIDKAAYTYRTVFVDESGLIGIRCFQWVAAFSGMDRLSKSIP